jgi:hypothetical protein
MPLLGIADSAVTALIKAFFFSIGMAVLMMLMALGFIYISTGANLPVSATVAMVIFALSFVATAVLLDHAGMERTGALLGGAALALLLTAFFLTVGCGIVLINGGGLVERLGLDTLLAGFAASVMASVVIMMTTFRV